MQAEALRKIVLDIKNLKAETQTIELKAAMKGCPTRLFDTLSSFSNQDEGGIIIFGIDGHYQSRHSHYAQRICRRRVAGADLFGYSRRI